MIFRRHIVISLIPLFYFGHVQIAHGFGTNFVHDQKTVYCYYLNAPYIPGVTPKRDENSNLPSGIGSSCPVKMDFEVASLSVKAGDNIDARWTVEFIPNQPNSLNLFTPTVGLDQLSGKYYQIIHSNLHACDFGSLCSPFFDGANPKNPTENQVTNFTNNKAQFSTQSMVFDSAGDFSVVAHIILPGPTTSTRYDFAVYARVAVTSSSKSIQPWVIGFIMAGIIIFVGAIIIGVIRYRRTKQYDRQSQSLGNEPLVTITNHSLDESPKHASSNPTHSTDAWDISTESSSRIPTAVSVDARSRTHDKGIGRGSRLAFADDNQNRATSREPETRYGHQTSSEAVKASVAVLNPVVRPAPSHNHDHVITKDHSRTREHQNDLWTRRRSGQFSDASDEL